MIDVAIVRGKSLLASALRTESALDYYQTDKKSKMVVFWSGMHFIQILTAREATPGVNLERDPPLSRCVDISLGKDGSLEAVIISEASCIQEELECNMISALILEMIPFFLLAENGIPAIIPR